MPKKKIADSPPDIGTSSTAATQGIATPEKNADPKTKKQNNRKGMMKTAALKVKNKKTQAKECKSNVPKPPLDFEEFGDEDINAYYDQDRDGGGGEGPEHMYQKRMRHENPLDSDEIERFGSADSDDHKMFTKQSTKKKHREAPGRPY
jgi:hypothetical protein